MITEMTVTELMKALTNKEITSREAVESYYARIYKEDPQIGAYISLWEEKAIKKAQELDTRRSKGEELHPLAGIPVAIKDNICTKDIPTTCASRMLEHFVPPYDATVMEKLKQTVVLGKVNMDEFAMGSTTETSYFHPTRNPRNRTRVPGGSSGGSAAAVAAKLAPFALGSDTGGSIRQPAAFCGVVGMKPTYGVVSRYGLIAFASSLDQIGPLTRTVEDSAQVLEAIAGYDAKDSTSVPEFAQNYTSGLGQEIRGKRVALPREFYEEGLHPEIREAIYKQIRILELLGVEVVEVSMPVLKEALPAYYVISSAEASSNLARFDGISYGYHAQQCKDLTELYVRSRSEGFGPEVKRRIMLGTYALSAGYYDAYYNQAMKVRTLVRESFRQVLENCDMILSPVTPTTAYPLGQTIDNPLEMYMGDIYTVPVNIAGNPSLAMPCGVDQEGLPIGMQLIGRPFDEAGLYQVGYALEKEAKV